MIRMLVREEYDVHRAKLLWLHASVDETKCARVNEEPVPLVRDPKTRVKKFFDRHNARA